MMDHTISAKELRARLQEVVAQVRKGSRFTVLYRSRPAFDIVPVGTPQTVPGSLQDDTLYQAAPVGSSATGDVAGRHDEVIYR